MQDQWLTLDEAAVLLLVDRETIERWFSEGLARQHGGDQPMIRRSELDRFLQEHGQGFSRDAALEGGDDFHPAAYGVASRTPRG